MKKTVLVTGSNSGFGYLTALKFARNGYKVYATVRSMEREGVKEMKKIKEAEGLDIEWLIIDLTKPETILSAKSKVSQLDVLINNAGYGLVGEIEDLDEADVAKQMDTNFAGMFRMIKAFLPIMKSQRSGHIINISSIAGIVTYARYGIYSASKFAVEGMSEALRSELKRYNIKVSMVQPGRHKTGFSKNIQKIAKEGRIERDSMLRSATKKIIKLGNPQKVADRVYKLAQQRNPRLRNYVGIDAYILKFIKWVSPGWLWDFANRVIEYNNSKK